MLEIEIKLIGLDLLAFERQVQKSGAIFDVLERQTNWRINSTRHPIVSPSYLRLRKIEVEGQEDILEFTFKTRRKTEEARINAEETVHVDDADQLLQILASMGFDRVEKGTKERKRYLWKDCRIEFDVWDIDSFPFPYVEVEGESQQSIDNFLEAFAIDPRFVSTLSIAELQAAWQEGKLSL